MSQYGVPMKEGTLRISNEDWDQIRGFIESRDWKISSPALPSDLEDPLLAKTLPYGAFMMGFDFHLTDDGPKLIEINTNAGGLASVSSLSYVCVEKMFVMYKFLVSIKKEFELARGDQRELKTVVIMDDNCREQKLYPEVLYLQQILVHVGISTFVLDPEEVTIGEDKKLYYEENEIDLIYNRMTDFRLVEENHQHIRESCLADQIVLTPHPSAYVRYADKRNLSKIVSNVVPETLSLKDRSMEYWTKEKKHWVFKPPDGAASKGVYRGDKISVKKLKELPGETIAQQYCPPGISEGGTKFDIRVYTQDTNIIAISTRHFNGQVMEMRSETSGFQRSLPGDVCCFPVVMSDTIADKRILCSAGIIEELIIWKKLQPLLVGDECCINDVIKVIDDCVNEPVGKCGCLDGPTQSSDCCSTANKTPTTEEIVKQTTIKEEIDQDVSIVSGNSPFQYAKFGLLALSLSALSFAGFKYYKHLHPEQTNQGN